MSAVATRPWPAGTRAVAERHRIDEAALARCLGTRLAAFGGPLTIRQFAGGQSNPTYLLRTPGADYVLRKKPPGKLAPAAHAVDREYRVLEALQGTAVPVPRVQLYCDDADVIGTPFYVMDYVPGRIFEDPALPGLSAGERGEVYARMADTLAAIHALDWQKLGLAGFGRAEGFLERQLRLWGRPFTAQDGHAPQADEPDMQRLLAWLGEHRPAREEVTLIHGDYRLGNLLIAEQASDVVAVLDWELATLGHPLTDLAFNCMVYHLPAGHPVSTGLVGLDLDALGIPDEAQYVARYAARRGLTDGLDDWLYFKVFSLFRIAAIQYGVYQRACQGNAASETAQLFGESYRLVAATGVRLIDRA